MIEDRYDDAITATTNEMSAITELRKKLESMMSDAARARATAVAEADQIISQALTASDQLLTEVRGTVETTRSEAEDEARTIVESAESEVVEAREAAARSFAVAELAGSKTASEIQLAGVQAKEAVRDATRKIEDDRVEQVARVDAEWELQVAHLKAITGEHVNAAKAEIDAWRAQYVEDMKAAWLARLESMETVATNLRGTLEQSEKTLAAATEALAAMRAEMGSEIELAEAGPGLRVVEAPAEDALSDESAEDVTEVRQRPFRRMPDLT